MKSSLQDSTRVAGFVLGKKNKNNPGLDENTNPKTATSLYKKILPEMRREENTCVACFGMKIKILQKPNPLPLKAIRQTVPGVIDPDLLFIYQ